ncbi:hypothetical protein [Streptomyces mirabilis]|uniref:hypothetical protein n=1 Tax=Streptomyces mirabilis TaxID=68239 RepID=UPI0036DCB1BC
MHRSVKHPDTTGPIELEVEAEYLSDAENKADELFESKFHAVTFGMGVCCTPSRASGRVSSGRSSRATSASW